MLRYFQRTWLVLAIAGMANSAWAFSMLGPFDTWQIPRIGYNPPGAGDIGGPMNLGEEYRWNIKTLTYGFDDAFLTYFGLRGVEEINKAVAIINNLPPVSKMSADLREFPSNSRRMNFQASALFLLDLKSAALGTLMEEIGLASPERYTWTLRNRVTIGTVTFYTVIKRNFDPVTLAPTSYVNDQLYTYHVVEFTGPWADAVERSVDPLADSFTAVASATDGLFGGFLTAGEFFTGLTREDVGGLRYIYNKNNFNIENLITGTTGGSGGAFTPAGTSNTVVDVGMRLGVEKIVLKPVNKNGYIFGNSIAVTNQYTDTYINITNLPSMHRIKQRTQRALTQPDILFTAQDLGGNPGLVIGARTTTASWSDNDALNGVSTLAGPGVIQPPVVITFNRVGPAIVNDDSDAAFLEEAGGVRDFVWGSFDGTTNAPVVYPIGSSIQELELQVLGGQ